MDFLNEAWGFLAVVVAVIASLLYSAIYKPKLDIDMSDSFTPPEPFNPAIEPPIETNKPTDNSTYLYLKSKSFLGHDLTPADEIPDYVACVSQLQEVYRRTFGEHIGFGSALYSTKALKDHLLTDKKFKRVSFDEALAGDICVYATGEGKAGTRGHCFVVGKRDWMSNNSKTGLWSADYTKDSAKVYYTGKLGMQPFVFRCV